MAIENVTPQPLSNESQRLTIEVHERTKLARARATTRAYDSDLLLYRDWCAKTGETAFPAAVDTIARYIVHMDERDLALATIRRRLMVIRFESRRRGVPIDTANDLIRDTLKGINRRRDNPKPARKAPLAADEIEQLITALPNDARGRRDKAFIALGYHGAMRRSEVSALRVEWMRPYEGGIEIKLPRSKTDQEGQGTSIILEPQSNQDLCPVMLLRRHLNESGIKSGPVFRKIDRHGNLRDTGLTGGALCIIVKKHVASILGRKDDEIGFHSLRASFATTLDARGVSLAWIMEAGRWKNADVARGYIRSDRKRFKIGDKLAA